MTNPSFSFCWAIPLPWTLINPETGGAWMSAGAKCQTKAQRQHFSLPSLPLPFSPATPVCVSLSYSTLPPSHPGNVFNLGHTASQQAFPEKSHLPVPQLQVAPQQESKLKKDLARNCLQ